LLQKMQQLLVTVKSTRSSTSIRCGHLGRLPDKLFNGMIVELDSDHHRMIVSSEMPRQIADASRYDIFRLTYIKNKPFIEIEIGQSGTQHKSLFLFDRGYQRAIMLDSDTLTASEFQWIRCQLKKKLIMHRTKGNEIPVIIAELECLKIGRFTLKNVPAQIMTQGKPMPGANVHYFGMGVLKRFNTVLDF
jgi:hypothetical protein